MRRTTTPMLLALALLAIGAGARALTVPGLEACGGAPRPSGHHEHHAPKPAPHSTSCCLGHSCCAPALSAAGAPALTAVPRPAYAAVEASVPTFVVPAPDFLLPFAQGPPRG